jgi:hypothetical protein
VPNILISVPTKKDKQPLSVTHPELAKEADGWDPAEFTSGSSKQMSWQCELGHIWLAMISNRTRQKQGCPFCSGKRLVSGVNDLFTFAPHLANEADGWDISTVHRTSNKSMNWKCKLGHKWSASVSNRSLRDGKCPICSGKKVLAGYNDLATLEPEFAKEADGWDPTRVTKYSNKKVDWKCASGHKWSVSINSRSTFRTGCPTCSGQKILPGFNDLATINPALAIEAFNWDPSTYAQWSHELLTWKCNLGHIYKARIADRSSGDGCPFCIGKRVLVGFNDLETKNPSLALQAFGWDPKTVTEFSNKILMWQCAEGHRWNSSVNHRSNDRGCPSCANSGFDPNIDGSLYLIQHAQWEMIQIGITNFPADRLKKHKGNGWEVIELRGPMDGHLTQQWETAILRMLKAKGADLSNDKIAGKFDGYSEAWSKSTFEVSSIKELMRMTEEFEIDLKN